MFAVTPKILHSHIEKNSAMHNFNGTQQILNRKELTCSFLPHLVKSTPRIAWIESEASESRKSRRSLTWLQQPSHFLKAVNKRSLSIIACLVFKNVEICCQIDIPCRHFDKSRLVERKCIRNREILVSAAYGTDFRMSYLHNCIHGFSELLTFVIEGARHRSNGIRQSTAQAPWTVQRAQTPDDPWSNWPIWLLCLFGAADEMVECCQLKPLNRSL